MLQNVDKCDSFITLGSKFAWTVIWRKMTTKNEFFFTINPYSLGSSHLLPGSHAFSQTVTYTDGRPDLTRQLKSASAQTTHCSTERCAYLANRYDNTFTCFVSGPTIFKSYVHWTSVEDLLTA